jgi:hypothetical protein
MELWNYTVRACEGEKEELYRGQLGIQSKCTQVGTTVVAKDRRVKQRAWIGWSMEQLCEERE